MMQNKTKLRSCIKNILVSIFVLSHFEETSIHPGFNVINIVSFCLDMLLNQTKLLSVIMYHLHRKKNQHYVNLK